jgi:hypothetical protein
MVTLVRVTLYNNGWIVEDSNNLTVPVEGHYFSTFYEISLDPCFRFVVTLANNFVSVHVSLVFRIEPQLYRGGA